MVVWRGDPSLAMASPWTTAYAVSSPRTSTSLMGNDGTRRASVSAAPSVPDILDRPRDKTRADEVSRSALQFLFAEMVSYCQERVSGIAQFEQLLGSMGRRVGIRLLILVTHRTQTASNPKRPQRETRLLKTLLWLDTSFWKSAFGFQADSLERSTESVRTDECTWVRQADIRYDLL